MNLKKILSKTPQKTVFEKNKTTHAFINGDCLKILKKFPENSIDLIVTDPPYNVNLDYGKFYDDNKKRGEYYQWCSNWLEQCARILKKRGSFYLISYPEINARLLPYIEDQLKLNFKRWITWHYPSNIGHSKTNYTRTQRSILFFTKTKKHTFNREYALQPYKNPDCKRIKKLMKKGSKGRMCYDLLTYSDLLEMGEEIASDVLNINLLKNVSKNRIGSKDKNNKKKYHPCQLPLSLLRLFVKVSSNKKDILLDPFAGTFTLSAVASELERNSIGIEINPNYVDLGRKRVK